MLRMCHLESTMLLFRRAEIHERSCDFSSDLVERAIFGCLAVACHLKDSLSMPPTQQRWSCKITHVVTGSGFLSRGQTKSTRSSLLKRTKSLFDIACHCFPI